MTYCQMIEFSHLCDATAEYDAQIIGCTQWAYMCERHFRQMGNKSVYTVLKSAK